MAHWLISLTQMTNALKADYFNKCSLRPDKLRLNLEIKVVNSNFFIRLLDDLISLGRKETSAAV